MDDSLLIICRRICRVSLKIFNCDNQQQPQLQQQLQVLKQYINTALTSVDTPPNTSLAATLLGMHNIFQSFEADTTTATPPTAASDTTNNNAAVAAAATCRKSFTALGEQAANAFEVSTSFKDKLHCIQISILSTLYLYNYFADDNSNDEEVFNDNNIIVSLSEERVQLLSHVSYLFAQLVATSEAKSAIAEEFERRGVTTSIWLRLNQQTHAPEGQEILKDLAHLQNSLGMGNKINKQYVY